MTRDALRAVPLSATYAKRAPKGAFCVCGGERGFDSDLIGFDKFVWNEFGQPKAGPGGAQRRKGEAHGWAEQSPGHDITAELTAKICYCCVS